MGGIGGKYDLYLPEADEPIVFLQEEIPIEFMVISGKDIGEELFPGRIFQLSLNGAAIRSEIPLEPLTSIQIYFFNPSNSEKIRGDCYARVSEILENRTHDVWLQFTVISPEIEDLIGNWMMANKIPV